MKVKIFTLLLSVLLWGSTETYAQSKRIWDFSKGLSTRTVSNLNADISNWTSDATDDLGVTTRWKFYGTNLASRPLTANGEVIPETACLLFDTDGIDRNSILISHERLRVVRRFTKITFPKLKNGQTITIVGSSPNATATGRSITPVQSYLKYIGDKNVLTDGECVFLGKDVSGSQSTYAFKWQVETNEPDSVDVQFQIGDGGIDFLLFAIDITSEESVNISAQSEIIKYQAQLSGEMNDYIDKLAHMPTSVSNKYTLKFRQIFNTYNAKLQSLVDKYYLTSELSSHLSEALDYYTSCSNEFASTYNEAKDMDKGGGDMLPCRYDYVLVCDAWTENGTKRPGLNALFGDDYFLDVTGGTVSASKRSVDLSIVDGELVTEEIAAKYGGYGSHLNSLRLKGSSNVIAMNVVKGSKLILFYNNNGYERYPLFCKYSDMSVPISAESSMSATVDGKLQRMEWIAPEDRVVYIGSYGGDVYLSYIIVEATSLRSVSINLPQGSNAADYTNMWLDLTDTESGQKLHYVMSDQATYSFRNIPDNTTWNLVLRNQYGDVFGHIDNINVNGKDLNLTLDSLIKPQNVNLSVITPEGKDVTEQIHITWTDESGNESGQAPTLGGMMPGTKIGYRVTLPKELAMSYSVPDTTWHTVAESGNEIRHQLEPIKQVTLTGKVVDSATKYTVNGTSVSATQTFGGKYNKTLTAKTDAKGNFTLNVGNVPTSLNVAAPDYVSQNIICDSLMTGAETVAIPDVSLRPVTGAVISVAFSFASSIAEGESEDVSDWYDDYKNITYVIFNKTQHRQVNQFNVQHPQIVMLEEIAEGDVLELTATSRTSAFMPVTVDATIDADLCADVTFNITELGKIRASFEKNGNTAVVGSLYDADGKLLKSYDYKDATLTTDNLPDGKYTLVSMGSSKLFNTIYDLSRLPETGLVQGSDYTLNSVDVKSGVVSLINIDEIPTLDETKLYYTKSSSTYFTVNKLSVVSGNYLTLSAGLAFKPEYAADIDNVSLVVDLPESCSFVDNSVMLGTNMSGYSVTESQLIIPLKNISDRVRFCITPTLGGDYVSSAFVRFTLNGETITQPVGSINYSVKDLTIVVPSTATMATIPVSGTSVGASTIEIYDGNVLIGQTTALENGVWATTCDLNEPYNLSTHNIYAKIRTNNGLELVSETKNCVYDMNGIQVSKVTMYHWNSDMTTSYESVFDFLNPKTKPNQWTLNHHDKKFTYTVEFTENDPERISNVILYVHTADGSIVPSPAVYDEEKGLWCTNVDLGNTSNSYYPVNCSVDFDIKTNPAIDAIELNNTIKSVEINRSNLDDYITEIDSIEKSIEQHYDDNVEISDLFRDSRILSGAGAEIDSDIVLDGLSEDDAKKYFEQLSFEVNELLNSENYNFFEDAFTQSLSELSADMEGIIISSCKGLNPNKLATEGYEEIKTTDDNSVFILTTESKYNLVDLKNDYFISIDLTKDSNLSKILKSITATSSSDDFLIKMNDYFQKTSNYWENIQSVFSSVASLIEDIIEKVDTQWIANKRKLQQYDYALEWLKKQPYQRKEWAALRIQYIKERNKLNRNIAQNTKISNWLRRNISPNGLRIGKIGGGIFTLIDLASLINDARQDLTNVVNVYYSIPEPCENDQSKAENIQKKVRNTGLMAGGYYIAQFASSAVQVASLFAGASAIIPSGGSSITLVAGAITGTIVNALACQAYSVIFDNRIKNHSEEIKSLKCRKDCDMPGMPPCPDPKPTPKPNGGQHPSGAPHDNVKTDPSGYVYEGVPTNRLEGVTATVYYKEMVEDIYGDLHENIVKWNAEEYGQENPLITDKNGFYRWDVPQGLWQVKYEKEGYETAYSEWLPVPPPQLDVNIAMKQAVQPTITDARAYEDAIEFEFDKYMLPALLDSKNITVTVNGSEVEGTIQLLNEEASDESKSETFASKIRFNAEEPFNADKVTLNVSNKVESYAGVCMQDNFSKTLDIELEVRRIVCDSVATVGYGENGVITVSVLPAAASAGKNLSVKSSSPTILTTYADNVKIDENGEAEIIVTGALPGSAALMFSIDGYDLSASTIVNVKQIETVATPTASIASGTSVDKGTTITLSCATSGATIYYTLDGSCPCNDTPSRMVYDGTPIVLEENVTIQAMATAPDMYDSEVAEFTYIVKDLSVIDEITVEEELRIFPQPVRDKLNVKAGGNIIRSVVLINVAGATVAKTSVSSDYVSLDVSGLRPGVYVIIIETENKTYSRKILKVK